MIQVVRVARLKMTMCDTLSTIPIGTAKTSSSTWACSPALSPSCSSSSRPLPTLWPKMPSVRCGWFKGSMSICSMTAMSLQKLGGCREVPSMRLGRSSKEFRPMRASQPYCRRLIPTAFTFVGNLLWRGVQRIRRVQSPWPAHSLKTYANGYCMKQKQRTRTMMICRPFTADFQRH